jgi:hypothetical protein
MKKLVLSLLSISILIGITYIIYRMYVPQLIAKSVVSDDVPDFLPPKVKRRIERIKKPLNNGAATVITTLHNSNIPLEKVLKAIDNTEEEKIIAMVNHLSTSKITSADQAFTIAKSYIQADFDMEVFREPFTQQVDVTVLRQALKQARSTEPHAAQPDVATVKLILKQLLVEKEKEFQRNQMP